MPTLDWIGKKDVERHLQHEIPTHLLHCDRELSHGDPAFDIRPGTGNLLIEGDNLLALKALLPFYAGQVKCITIDPPYNTGNGEWIYNDNVKSPQMQQWLGTTVDREDLCRHEKWLCMMQARLHIHRRLLREDGAIFISIDDNEIHHLRMLCDEIFEPDNFVATIAWENFYGRSNAAAISPAHNYVMIYSPSGSNWKAIRNLLPRDEQSKSKYTNPDNDPKGRWRLGPVFAAEERNETLMYSITTPSGRLISPPKGSHWRMTQSEFWEMVKDKRILFGESGNNVPALKIYLDEVQDGLVPRSWWSHSEAGHSQEAKRELQAMFPNTVPFPTPKPTRLIERILQIATNPGDIVLDSFAGSGTTGHAVLKMNAQNPDQPPRRFVLVELEPNIAQPITRERLKRAIDGYGKHESLGGGFRFCQLGETVRDPEGGLNPNVSWRDLAHLLYLEKFGVALEASRLDEASGFVGEAGGVSLFLLFDKGAIAPLEREALKKLKAHPGPKVVYGDCCKVPTPILEQNEIEFYQAPYEVVR